MACVDLTYYQKNRDKTLAKNRSYYYANPNKLKEKRDNQSEERKNKLKEYYKQWCNNLLDEEKAKRRQQSKNW